MIETRQQAHDALADIVWWLKGFRANTDGASWRHDDASHMIDQARAVQAFINHELTPMVDRLIKENQSLREQAYFAAQGTEAQRAETVQQGSVHDGPVAEGDAPEGAA